MVQRNNLPVVAVFTVRNNVLPVVDRFVAVYFVVLFLFKRIETLNL